MFCSKTGDLVVNDDRENLDSNRILLDDDGNATTTTTTTTKNGTKPTISKLRTKVKCKNLTLSSSSSASSSSASASASSQVSSSVSSKSCDYRSTGIDNHTSDNVCDRKCSKNTATTTGGSGSMLGKNQKGNCSRSGPVSSAGGGGGGGNNSIDGGGPTCNSLLCSYCCCCCRRRRCNCRCHVAAATAAAAANHCLHHFLTDPQNNSQVSMEEAIRWKTSFEKLMNNDVGRKIFQEFLRYEYSEENIEFWLACENLKKVSASDPQLREKIQLIYDEFVSVQSSREVSLDSKVREIINRNMQSAETLSPNIFNEAQTQIYTLMHRDSYPRFLNSFFYKSILNTNDNERDNASDRNDNADTAAAATAAAAAATNKADNANDDMTAAVVVTADNAQNNKSSNQNNANNNNINDNVVERAAVPDAQKSHSVK